ncbi:interleukin-15 receptor subunit alpha isoform X2 [Plectropomus leopardus]|uniref:interleukin-15 receptor subunit alpha isoform X2 n=1 Tax=Plectropomus leopardus TaxID=160734 RepID=UPI001C4AC5ED|nr:interleukin-15 receptor subunit alpha isoform X2 [Plectropomus leopardus]
MDLSPLFSVCFMMICLLGAAICSNGDKNSCECPEPPRLNLTVPAGTCFKSGSSFRYQCIEGYVREAGTSNLIRCKKDDDGSAYWAPSRPTLNCKPDPKKTTTKPPPSQVTQGYTDILRDSTVTTTVTPSTSPQMTQSESPSSSETAEPPSAEPTTPGLWTVSDHSPAVTVDVRTGTKTTHRTTSTSTTTGTDISPEYNHAGLQLGSTTTALIGCASLAIVCALIGISIFCYRGRSKSNIPPEKAEERIPMNYAPTEQA